MVLSLRISLILAMTLVLTACGLATRSSSLDSSIHSESTEASGTNDNSSSTRSQEQQPQEKSRSALLPWNNYADAVSGLTGYKREMTIHFEPDPANGSSSSWHIHSIYTYSAVPKSQINQLSFQGDVLFEQIQSISAVRLEDEFFLFIPDSGCMTIDQQEFSRMDTGIVNPDYYLDGIVAENQVKSIEMANDRTASLFALDKHSLPRYADQFVSLDGQLFVSEDGGYPLRLILSVTGETDFLDNGEVQQGTLQLEMDLEEIDDLGYMVSQFNCLDTVPYPVPRDIFDLIFLDELLGFRTMMPVRDLVSFYQLELSKVGWQLVEEPTVIDGTTFLTFRFGQDELIVELEEASLDGSVSVLISP